MPNPLDAALGSVLGALTGDAAGARLEFLGRLPTAAEVDEAVALSGGGVWGVAPGQITDDGELTIALLDALADGGGFDLERIARSYRRWYDSGPFDIGGTIAAALGAADDAQGMRRAALRQIDSKANGSLMRASPLGVWGWNLEADRLAEHARADSALTHANAACQDAVACYAVAIASLIREEGDRRLALEAVAEWAERQACEEVRDWLDLAAGEEEVPGRPQEGFVKIALVHGFRQLRRGAGYKQAIRAVLALGGDSDTNACIAGGLIGAAVGAEHIPKSMRNAVLECDTSRGRPRPRWLHPRGVAERVQRLVGR